MIDIRDVKQPVAFPSDFTVWFFLLLVLIAAAGVYLFHRYKKRMPASAEPSPKEQSPWAKAYERLEALVRSGLLAQGEYDAFYLELSDIVRRYFEEQFRIKAPEMTTEEFLLHLKDSQGLTVQQQNALRDFLDACDMVKFARHAPLQEDARKNVGVAKRLIDETRQDNDATAGRQDGI